MIICEYGCGKEAKYQFKNGKWCCCEKPCKCSEVRRKNSEKNKGRKDSIETRIKKSESMKGKIFSDDHRRKIGESSKGKIIKEETRKKMSSSLKGKESFWKGKKLSEQHKRNLSNSLKGLNHPNFGKKHSKETKEKISNTLKGRTYSDQTLKKMKLSSKLNIKKIKEKYKFFSKIEEMRYNPNKQGDKEIQVRCKNHNCKNSKEQGGWFTPNNNKLWARINHLEKDDGNGGSYFYCCEQCKNDCPLYNLKYDPFKKENKINYTGSEYQTFREYVLERDNYECQYCGEKAEHIHHERPQKLEPFYSLDPDLAWSTCSKCHYEKGHQDECSTSEIRKIKCKGE